MPDVQFIGLILLMTVAVVAAYFYLKRVQQRDASKPDAAPQAPAAAEKSTADSDLGA